MANDNKNTHELAPDPDDDTSELELLPATYSDPALDYEAESDAATHSFDSLDAGQERKSVDTLQVELRERDDYIGRLEYDLEQLRARANGLETELKAREALTEGLAAELNEARQALLAARDRLDERDQAFTELEARLKASEAAHEEAVALQLSEIESLATQLAEIRSEYEKEREDRQSLEAQCNALEEQVSGLVSEAAALEAAAESTRPLRQKNERLSGALLGYTDEIRGLREQASRTETYADTLRRDLQDQAAELEAATTCQRSIQAALDDALAKIAELSESRPSDEQLASELVENTGERLSLESGPSPAEEERKQEMAKLERRIRDLEQELEDSESKVANKDAAISVLLAELANKPQAGASEVQADAPPHRPAERRVHAADEKHGGEKERTARLLVGTIDGQEVRFPLFKNKLTIGRTTHNDIQLKQQFISRRHAVVVCDNDSTRIVDWGSKNGIYVNGIRVSEKVLKSGDQLTVGTAEFRFEERPKR